MRVAVPPCAAKAWITAATCPCAAAVVLGARRGEGLGCGAQEVPCRDSAEGRRVESQGTGDGAAGMLHEWLDLAVESRVEEGASDGEAWEEPGRYRELPRAERCTEPPGCRQGVMAGSGRILSLPTAPLCGAPPQGMARHGGAGEGIQSPVWG